jgi:hypothetical protein
MIFLDFFGDFRRHDSHAKKIRGWPKLGLPGGDKSHGVTTDSSGANLGILLACTDFNDRVQIVQTMARRGDGDRTGLAIAIGFSQIKPLELLRPVVAFTRGEHVYYEI